ncbi:hypothetical protein CTAYLR_005150 [Chrysophaeum taylorii]|uniref:Chlorophyll a-b binding protein, chloroplastic n=1 Tax=Chrysophaeum taylorii TaxID=2483200 RepID=A0AAD7ULX6_9STRA|nr:hypothetical protein CTAYLR_005150 [Chrysophaeum taylorii]
MLLLLPTVIAFTNVPGIVKKTVVRASDPSFCDGLPGALPPVGQWDPLGFSNVSPGEIRRYREAETQHGRVAMLAVPGFLVAESWHPLFKDVEGPAIDHLTQVRQEYPFFFELLALGIGLLEVNRALQGWAFPDSRRVANTLKEDYYPGDVGFDPLGLKPTDPDELETMITRELQNGRLAMLAAAGFMAQELTNHKPILETLKLILLFDQTEIDKNLGIPDATNPLAIEAEIFSPAPDTFGLGN